MNAQINRDLKSPLTALNHRDNRRSRSGVFIHCNEKKPDFKSMKETIRDVITNMSREGAIPDSYLWQSSADTESWIEKRGKTRMAYYDFKGYH